MRKLFTLSAVIFCCLQGFGQAGQLNPSFGTNGIVKTSLSLIPLGSTSFLVHSSSK
ncbi:MAG TPA: hypothetical protein VGP55_02170 [Chitinophagaceae bacterium]|nr:hypothetical protein [Chitinophagaceae bacterium]